MGTRRATDGNPIGQVTADGSGNWSFTPGTPLANGTVVNATASDPTGNTSAPASTTVDSVAPAAPVVNPSNGAEISGTAEPGATVTLTDGSGNPIGQVTADGSGNWSFTPSTPLDCENHYIHSFELENGRIKRNREFMNPMQKLRALGIAVPQIKRDGIPT